MVTPIIVIADDYALSPGVSAAIRGLLAQGRLSGTGAMTCAPEWPDAARDLLALEADGGPAIGGRRFATGVHLVMTGGLPPLADWRMATTDGDWPRLAQWLGWAAVAGRRPTALTNLVAEEIERQLDAFESAMGRPPDFIDGHQHIHLLEPVRGLLLAAMQRRYARLRPKPWLRHCGDALHRIIGRGVSPGKALFIAFLARGLPAQAAARGIACNPSFAGIHDFKGGFAAKMQGFLQACTPYQTIMTHPGLPDDPLLAARDPLIESRVEEWTFLSSQAWPTMLTERSFALAVHPPASLPSS
jgi:chitin disaccharide deacetylase